MPVDDMAKPPTRDPQLPLFGGAAYARPPGWAEVRGRLAHWTGSGALPDPAAAPAS